MNLLMLRKSAESEGGSEEGELSEGESHPLVTLHNIKPDDIPEIPPNR